MSDTSSRRSSPARLAQLAEFRFQLRRFLNFSETVSERAGVAAQHYQLMQVIGALQEGESATITFLAERMLLRHNSVVELVDRATRAGLVRRTDDERDNRRSIVELTPAGRDTLDGLIAAHLAALDGTTGEALLRALEQLREGSESPQRLHAEGTA